MKLALITAGGCGRRMKSDIPKQFIMVNDRPVILYTLLAFQNHPDIDVICVVCLDGYQEQLAELCRKHNITKLCHIVTGGDTNQASIRLGLDELRRHYCDDDIVLIHDGVRPNVSAEIISDCIKTTRAHGNAITAIPCTEALLLTHDGKCAGNAIPRDNMRRTQTPQGFFLGDITDAHHAALNKGISNTIACCTLMTELGRTVYFSRGSETNIKLTTPEDFEIFRALLKVKK